MSLQAVDQFRELVKGNPEAAAACRDAMAKGGAGAVINLARKRGFEFSEDEAVATLNGGELSDVELELVAGGSPIGGSGCGGDNTGPK